MKFDINEIDLKALVDNMPDLLYYLDTDCKFLAYNSSCKKFLTQLGHPELLAGTDILACYPKERRETLLYYISQAKKHKIFSFEESFNIKGDTFYFDTTIYCLTNEQDQHMGFCVLAKDITEKRVFRLALQKTEERYRLLFQQNPMAIFVVGVDDMKIHEVNEMAVQQYGYSREEFLQLTALDLKIEDEHEKLVTLIQQVKRGDNPSSKGIWRHICKTGRRLFMEISYHRIIYEHKNAVMVMANDVTEKIILEEKLKQENELRQQQITEAVIVAQEKERSEIGKELHDNINQILGGTRLYIDVARRDEEKRDELLKLSSANLLNAIEEIRKLSKTLVAFSDYQMNLSDAVQRLIEDLGRVKPFMVELSAPKFDESQINEKLKLTIYRIIQEQLNNIIKHAEATHVHILLERHKGQIKLLIKDDGCGFDMKKEKHGIGIANIVSRTELYKGKLHLVSAPGKGCTLSVIFPVTTASASLRRNKRSAGRVSTERNSKKQ